MTALATRLDYEKLPVGTPVELCDGMLIEQPSPRYGHQRIQFAILNVLSNLAEPVCAAAGPVDVLVDELNVFVPDIVVLDHEPDDDDQYVGVPLAVFEILSPSTRDRDRNFKTRRLLGLGVKEVWLVDRHEQKVDIVSVNETRTFEDGKRAKSDVVRGLELVPNELFRTGN